ncbi:glycogen synthase [bacterium]|nr:glycogen synthase [bacterium]
MKNSLKIVFVSSEVAPFAKTGGLADVSGSLPNYLKKLGADVSVFMPNYSTINHLENKIQIIPELQNVPVRLGFFFTTFSVFKGKLPNSDVDIFFIDSPYYFHRGKIYTNDSDEDERFLLFQRAVLETVQRLQWKVDLFHCNDWQTALIPVFLKTIYNWDKLFYGTKTLLSIHNLAYQGVFGKQTFYKFGLNPTDFFQGSDFEYFGNVNFLKEGILYADCVSTVSKKYAEEIQTEEFGCTLEKTLKRRAGRVFGILNGVDYDEWSPEKDKLIPFNYSKNDLSGKLECKKDLLKKAKLSFSPNTPVLGIVSRLTPQKGLKLISEIIFGLANLNLQLCIVGSGDKNLENFFQRSANSFPNKISFHSGFSNELAHLVEAGSDIFVMPSVYEPCGLNQIYSLKYGTIPVVRKTGGLADTIEQFNFLTGEGNGFVFEEFSAHELYWTIKFVIDTFANKKAWNKIIENAMDCDFSWEHSAKEYFELYKTVVVFY